MKRALQGLLIAGETMRDAVLNDTKKITIREGHRDYTPGPVLIGCHLLNWATIRIIISVRHTTLIRLHPKDWIADGCNSQEELLQMLRQFYPDLNLDSEVTVIEWR